MPLLVCYDISNDRLRVKIANKLRYFGLDNIQYSVFLGKVKAKNKKKLISSLKQLIETKGGIKDSIFVIELNPSQIQNMQVLGKRQLDLDLLRGMRYTIYI